MTSVSAPITTRDWRRCSQQDTSRFAARMADKLDILGFGQGGKIHHHLILESRTREAAYSGWYHTNIEDDGFLHRSEKKVKYSKRNPLLETPAKLTSKRIARHFLARALFEKKVDMNTELEFITSTRFTIPTIVDCADICVHYRTATLSMIFDQEGEHSSNKFSGIVGDIPIERFGELSRPCYEVFLAFPKGSLPYALFNGVHPHTH